MYQIQELVHSFVNNYTSCYTCAVVVMGRVVAPHPLPLPLPKGARGYSAPSPLREKVGVRVSPLEIHGSVYHA